MWLGSLSSVDYDVECNWAMLLLMSENQRVGGQTKAWLPGRLNKEI